MEKIKYGEKLASNVPREVMKMLRKRQSIENRNSEKERQEAERARQASQMLLKIREKLWRRLFKFCEAEDLLREIEELQKKAEKTS